MRSSICVPVVSSSHDAARAGCGLMLRSSESYEHRCGKIRCLLRFLRQTRDANPRQDSLTFAVLHVATLRAGLSKKRRSDFPPASTEWQQRGGVDARVSRLRLMRRYILALFQKLLAYLMGIQACASSHRYPQDFVSAAIAVRVG